MYYFPVGGIAMSNEKVDRIIDLLNANGSSKALKIADMIYINYYCSYEDKENKCSLYNINNAIYSYFLTLIDRKSRYRCRVKAGNFKRKYNV